MGVPDGLHYKRERKLVNCIVQKPYILPSIVVDNFRLKSGFLLNSMHYIESLSYIVVVTDGKLKVLMSI